MAPGCVCEEVHWCGDGDGACVGRSEGSRSACGGHAWPAVASFPPPAISPAALDPWPLHGLAFTEKQSAIVTYKREREKLTMHIGVRVIRHPVAIVTSITRVYMAWWRQSVAVFRVHWGSRRELPRGIWWRGVDCMRGEHVGVGRVGGVHSCSLCLAQVAILHCKVHRRVCGVGRRGTVQCSGLGLVRGSQ